MYDGIQTRSCGYYRTIQDVTMTKEHEEKQHIDTMGGQAVIEGVLMRSPYGYAIAIRRPHNNEIVVQSRPYIAITRRIKLLGLPFVRGVVTLFEMLIIGIRALNFSAREWEQSMLIMEEEEKQRNEKEDAKPQKVKKKEKTTKKKNESAGMAFAMALGLAMAILLVVVLPNLLTSLTGRLFHMEPSLEQGVETPVNTTQHDYAPSEKSALVEEQRPFLYNLVAGCYRALILLGYIVFISLLKDVRRVFEYHGAEHKTVYAYEKEGEVSVENARKYSTLHPRCGTAFLAVVIVVSIVVFALIAWAVASIWPGFTTLPFVVKKAILICLHIVFLPLVAGTAYEVIRISSRYYDKFWGFRIIVLPGILFQKITTRQPDDAQLEVAIASLKAALSLTPPTNTIKERSVR